MSDYGTIEKQLSRIADALEHLVEQGRILKDSKAITKVLKAEDEQFNKETLEIAEEVLMDLSRVTIMVITLRAVLVAKEGYQKWVPISTLQDKYISEKHLNDEDQKFDYKLNDSQIKEGVFFTDSLHLNDNGEKWIHKKKWDKLQVAKK